MILTIWHCRKDKTVETVKKIGDFQGLRKGGMNRQHTENFYSSESTLYEAM
jgi:hypothetical protein